MREIIEHNGKTYSLSFKHYNYSCGKNGKNTINLDLCLNYATHVGQIKKYNKRNEENVLRHNKIKGATACSIDQIVIEEGNKYYLLVDTTYSFCSNKDQFNKKIGRKIARGRAINIIRSL